MIDIGAATKMILTQLRSTGLLVGDGIAPKEGGWVEGAPNIDAFLAYSVVGFAGASPAYPDVGLLRSQDWATTWTIRHHGGSRDQLDFQATAARTLCLDLHRKSFGVAHSFTVIELVWRSLGENIRNDQIDPPFWSSTDVIMLGCSD